MNGKEILGKCHKKKCNGNYISFHFAGIGSDGMGYYDGKCDKCGDTRCLVSPISKWFKENHSILNPKA